MTRSRRGKGGHGGGGGGGGGHGGGDDRWLITYADLLTLLMVLFLVLWVISTIDLKKFEEFKSGLGDFGNKAANAAPAEDAAAEAAPDETEGSTTTSEAVEETTTTTTIAPGEPGSAGPGSGPPLTSEQLAGMVSDLNAAVGASGLEGVVDVHVEERGLVVSISTDNVLFDSGVGALTPAGKVVIGSVAPELAALSNKVIIEGYTDKRPLNRPGYDNWDLSVDRAVSVLKVLRDDFGFDSTRLAATGYGDQHPIAEGDDEASLARNRRVELVIVAADDAATTTATTSAGD